MRILHFADLHLGVENFGRQDAATGLNSRLLDFLRAFEFIVNSALSRQVDLILFCGDAFRSREPSPTLQCLFAEQLGRLSAAGIPVLLLLGNHDLPPLPGRRSALEIYPLLSVPKVEVVTAPGLKSIETRSGPLQIACLPAGITESAETIAGLIREMTAQLTRACPALLAAHVSIQGARVGSESRLLAGREVMLPRELLLNPAFCYVALGHVHRFQDLNPGKSPPVVYCGSPERVDFNEQDEPKGFVMVEIHDGRAKYEFVETPARRFVTVAVNLKAGDTTLEVLEAIAEQEIEDAVVKVVLKSEEAVAADEREIRHALEKAAWALPVVREIAHPPARTRAPSLSRGGVEPLVALEEYLKTTRFSEERKTQLRRAAERLVRGD